MKKTIVTLALASAALLSTSAFAQTANNNNCPAAPCPPAGLDVTAVHRVPTSKSLIRV